MIISETFLWISVVSLAFLLFLRRTSRENRPPGPPGLPLIGNVLQMTNRELWVTFTEWKKTYGPITYLSLAGQPAVILNSHQVASDLLDKRAGIYSDRPRNIVASELLCRNLALPLTRYGDLWRSMRRAAHEGLHRGSAARFFPIQEKEAGLLADEMLDDPNTWENAIRRSSGSFILSVVYDYPPLKSTKDPIFNHIKGWVHRMEHAAYPGNHMVEFFTWMIYLPNWMAKWKHDAEVGYKNDGVIFKGWYGDVEKRISNGDDRPSLSATLINGKDQFGLSTTEASFLAASMYGAGADTTAATLTWFIHSMVLYPEVQRQAQAELDSVIGRSRVPTYADQDKLPYIRALVKELIRLRPTTPIGLPHASVQDDWYEGYFIPKGTLCIANVWGMNRDPDIYGPDANEFNPARHLTESGTPYSIPETKGEGHVTFGFGKRVCIGRHVANNTLFISIATILWASLISPAKDSNGQPIIPPETIMHDQIVVRPEPFNCSIVPRFPEAKTLLTQTNELRQ